MRVTYDNSGFILAEANAMRVWRGPHLAAVTVVGLVMVGCEAPPRGSDEPGPVEGPNQVVLKVPGMT